MAKVWLADYECRPRRAADDLPDVCLVCGDDAADTVRRDFRWHPAWMYVFLLVGLLPAVILLLLLSKRMAVDCPVCDRHRGHWWKGNLLAAALVLGGFALLIGGLVLGGLATRPNQPMPAWVPLVCVGGLLAGLISGVVVSNRVIRPVEITAHDIQLTNVSDEFVAALKDKRRADRERRGDDA